jgi:predicted component of type VI protein secretion system
MVMERGFPSYPTATQSSGTKNPFVDYGSEVQVTAVAAAPSAVHNTEQHNLNSLMVLNLLQLNPHTQETSASGLDGPGGAQQQQHHKQQLVAEQQHPANISTCNLSLRQRTDLSGVADIFFVMYIMTPAWHPKEDLETTTHTLLFA